MLEYSVLRILFHALLYLPRLEFVLGLLLISSPLNLSKLYLPGKLLE